MSVFKDGVRKNAVQEKKRSCGKDEVVQVSPERAADASAKERA